MRLRPGRSVDELYVTAATFDGGRLWAVSAAYSTLLSIDIQARTIVKAYTLPNLHRPVGMAVRAGRFVVAEEDGSILVVPVPVP